MITRRRQKIGFTLAAVLWIAGVVVGMVSGEFAEQSPLRKGLDLFLLLLSVYLLWTVWGSPAEATPSGDVR